MNKEVQQRLVNKFFNDPDFHFVLEMLSKKTERLRDIGTIELSDSAETIKAIVAGRQETIKLVDEFARDVETSKATINNITTTFI